MKPKSHRKIMKKDKGIILVAEDNRVNQLVIKGLLKQLGYQVVLAENGAGGAGKASG